MRPKFIDVSRRERYLMLIYAKTALEGYTKVEEVIEGMDAVFIKRALATRCGGDALKQSEELIELIEKKKRLIRFFDDIRSSVESLKAEHKRIIKERYGITPGGVTDKPDRNYFRKLLLATEKFAAAMRDLGYTDERYGRIVDEFCFLDEIYYEKKRRAESLANGKTLHNFGGVSLKRT